MAADPAAIQSVDQLVQARELRGLAQSDLAARLGMVLRQIQAIERGDWRSLPGRSFARSAVRAYGRVVSVNVESLLVAIDAEYGVEGEPINRPPLDQPMPRRGVLGFSSSGSGHWLTWTVLAILALTVIAFFFGGGASLLDLGDSAGSSSRAGTAVASSSVAAASRNSSAADPANPSGSPGSGAEAPSSSTSGLSTSQVPASALSGGANPAAVTATAGSAGGTSAPSGSAASGPAGASAVAPAAAGSSQQAVGANSVQPPQASGTGTVASSGGLVLRFAADTWIEIRDGADKVVATGTQPAGTTRSFEIAPPVSGTIGNVNAVSVTWRGAPFDLTPFLRQGVARFRIERGDR